MINEEVRHVLVPKLMPGEELLWAAKRLRPSWPGIVLTIPLFGFWAAGCLVFAFIMIAGDPYKLLTPQLSPLMFRVVGVLLLVVLGLACLRVLTFIFGRHYYAVSQMRVIILTHLMWKTLTTIPPERLGKITRTGRSNYGSLGFDVSPIWGLGPGFFNIINPDQVKALIDRHFGNAQ